MGLKWLLTSLGPVVIRKGILALAVLALGAQVMLIGKPAHISLNLFNPVVTTYANVLLTPEDPVLGLVTYASQTNLPRPVLDSDRDTVAILRQDSIIQNGAEILFPVVALIRSPSRTGVAKSEHRVLPFSEQTQSPSTFTRGELDPYFASATTPSEELIIGFQDTNTSKLAVLRNFDAAALPTTSNANPDINIHHTIRFNCRSNAPVPSPDGSVQYQPCNDDPLYPDPTSFVRSISAVDINCDSKLDIMVVADSTQDINDDDDRETGQRVFGCINYTVPGSSNLDFRCRDQGFRGASAVTTGRSTERDLSPCNGSDACGGGGGGGVELPPLPLGARFATNLGNTCSGEYRGIGASDYTVVEFLGNFNHPTPAIAAVQRSYTGPVAQAELAFINNDSLPDAVVLMQPIPSYLPGPQDMNSAARVEVCLRDLSGDGLECTLEAQPRMVARGVYRDGEARYEYRSASLAGIADTVYTCDAAPEILVASTGAGLGANDPQANGYVQDYGEATKDLSLMALSKARLSSYNLPLSSLCLWPGSPQSSNQSVCAAAPTGPAPLVMYAALGNFTSRTGRNPALTYPVDSVMLLRKEGFNANRDYEVTHEVQFVSSDSSSTLRTFTKSFCIADN